MKKIILNIALILFIISNINAQELKEIRMYKNGDVLYRNILTSTDSIKFSTSGLSRLLHYIQNGNEVETIDVSEIDSVKFFVFNYEIFTNSNDPLFAQITTDNGNCKMLVSGEKDENGKLLEINNIKVIINDITYDISFSDGKVTELHDNKNNSFFLSYNEEENIYDVAVIPENSDTIYYSKIPYYSQILYTKAKKSLRNFKSEESLPYYLRYKIKLEYIPEAPYAHFSTNYYTHIVKMCDNLNCFERNEASIIEIGNNYAIYQLKLNEWLENEPTQNDIAAGIEWILNTLDVSKITLGELLSMLADGLAMHYNLPSYNWNDAMSYELQQLTNKLIDFEIDPWDLSKLIRTDRKLGDDYTFFLNVTGTGSNWQFKQGAISYTNLKQQQGNPVHLEITLTNIYPFEEDFMYSTDAQISTNTCNENEITVTTAIVSGSIDYVGKPPYTKRGICWSTSSNPTINDNKKEEQSSTIGVYSFNLTGLEPDKPYHARAYVIQNGTTIYGNEISFATKPAVAAHVSSEYNESEIEGTSAIIYGKVTNVGDPPYIERGICWSTHSNPTTNDNKETVNGNSGQLGLYSCNIIGLEPNTPYYAKAYVIQNNTTIYGNEITFTTKPWVLINGVKWATRNVGAPGTFVTNPNDYGGYYQWNRGENNWIGICAYKDGGYGFATTWQFINNPCPVGWRVPTRAELVSLVSAGYTWSWAESGGLFGNENNTVFLPAAGSRLYSDGTFYKVGIEGDYYSSETYGDGFITCGGEYADLGPYSIQFRSDYICGTVYGAATNGKSIRCVKE